MPVLFTDQQGTKNFFIEEIGFCLLLIVAQKIIKLKKLIINREEIVQE